MKRYDFKTWARLVKSSPCHDHEGMRFINVALTIVSTGYVHLPPDVTARAVERFQQVAKAVLVMMHDPVVRAGLEKLAEHSAGAHPGRDAVDIADWQDCGA